MEPTTGFEPVTPSLPRKCSTPEPRGLETPVDSPEAGAWASPTVKPCDPTSSPTWCKAPSFAGGRPCWEPVESVPRRTPEEKDEYCARRVPACLVVWQWKICSGCLPLEQPPPPRPPHAQAQLSRLTPEGRGHVLEVAAQEAVAQTPGVAVPVEAPR